MNTTELRNFISRIENLNKAKTWLKAKRLETNSTVTEKDFEEVKFKLAKERVTEVIKEVDVNFDAHFQEPAKVVLVYNNKLRELKEGGNFTEEERKMIGSKIKYIENHIEKRLLEFGNDKTEKKTIAIENFFTDKASPEVITALQQNFKHLKNKEMAVLIYLLHKKHHLIRYDNTNKNKTILNFVRAFTGIDYKQISGINRFIEPTTENIKLDTKNDKVLKIIEEQFNKVVSSC